MYYNIILDTQLNTAMIGCASILLLGKVYKCKDTLILHVFATNCLQSWVIAECWYFAPLQQVLIHEFYNFQSYNTVLVHQSEQGRNTINKFVNDNDVNISTYLPQSFGNAITILFLLSEFIFLTFDFKPQLHLLFS